MKKTTLTSLAIVGVSTVSLLSGNSASAVSLVNGTGLTSPALTITADEFVFANETVLTNEYASLGVTFSPNTVYNPNNGVLGGFAPAVTGNYFGNFDNLGKENFTNPFSIQFSTDQTEAAFGLVAVNAGTATFTALLNGSTVESFSNAVASSSQFYGFTGITFDEIQVSLDLGANDPLVVFDNIQLGTVPSETTPEPSTILGLLAVGSLGALARKGKKG